MRGLVPYAWRSLVARPARTLLTLLGIAIGTGVLTAGLAVNAGLEASIQRTVAELTGRADLRITAFGERGLSAASLAALDDVAGVALTAPAIERRTFLEPVPGRSSTAEPVTVLGIDPAREPRVRDFVLAAGTFLEEPAPGGASGTAVPALVTETLASAEALLLGDELPVLGAGRPVEARVVGILAGDGPALGTGGRTVILPIQAAARLTGEPGGGESPETPGTGPGGITRVEVILAAGADLAMATAGLEQALTREPYLVAAPRDVAASMRASTADVRGTMALLAAMTLFAAAFLILNTLSMTVVERVRELGLLRAAGAGRLQVIRVVMAQALLLGLVGSVAGLALGGALAWLVAGWLRAAGGANLDAPALTPGVLATGLAAGLLITLVTALEPARRAASVSPVVALRSRSDPAATVRAHAGWLVLVALAVGAVAVLLLPIGGGTTEGAARAAAVYVLLLLAVLLTPALLGPLGRLVGLPFAVVLRLEERLARAAIARDPGRTTLTVGALVLGLAMVVAMGSVSVNARAAATAWLGDVVPGDEILTAIAPVPAGEEGLERDLAAIPGVRLATPIASFDLAFRGNRLEATAVRGADLLADGRLTFVAGDRQAALEALDAGGAVILSRSRAERLGLGLGAQLAVVGTGGLVELEVVGIVERSFPGRGGETVLVGWTDATERLGVNGADAFAVRYEAEATEQAGRAVAELARQLALSVAPIERVEGAVGDALDRVFGLLDLLALAAVAIAGLGIVNTLSMDTWERVRELGMLRAAGMSRRQVWRSVLVEAGILGAIGGVMGVLAGLAAGVLLVVTGGARLEEGIRLPWPTIAAALLLGLGLAMAAAAQPARMAGRRSIVSAVRGE